MCSEPVIAHARQRLLRRILVADRHQARHLVLGDGDLFAAPVGQRQIGDFVIRVNSRVEDAIQILLISTLS